MTQDEQIRDGLWRLHCRLEEIGRIHLQAKLWLDRVEEERLSTPKQLGELRKAAGDDQ